jgi:putative acetyltransferase
VSANLSANPWSSTSCGESAVPIAITRESVTSDVARALIEARHAELTALYADTREADFVDLPSRDLVHGAGVFLVARLDGRPVGCGALRRLGDDQGEIKRMYVVPDARRQGVGRAVLTALEAEARQLGIAALILETGERQPEAIALYRSAGFERCPCWGDYLDSPLAVCLAKPLVEGAIATGG